MTYSIKAEEIKGGWIFHITGGFDGSSAPKYHNKKAKISGVDIQVALEKALKQLGITKYQHKLKVETLADKQAVIDFYRKPVPKLFKRLELEFQNSDQVYFQLIEDNKIEVNFSLVYIDLNEEKHYLSAEITESDIIFMGNNDFFRHYYKNEINKIIDIVKGWKNIN